MSAVGPVDGLNAMAGCISVAYEELFPEYSGTQFATVEGGQDR